METYKIGKLKLKNRFFLAPMLEPNDIVFRLLCKKAGCALTFTGMLNPLNKKELIIDDKPAIQLFTNNTKGIKEFIKKHDKKVSLWDFNLGCPSKLSKRLGHGAFMHKDFESLDKIFKEIRSSTKKPCTIKLRKSPQALEIVRLAERNKFDAIAIHPRTDKQGYSGEPDYEFALRIKSSTKLPIIYSGNVSLKNADSILKDFDFVFIGREAIGNPNIFSELVNKESKITFKDYLRLAKKYNISFKQIKYQAMNFTKGMKDAKELRREIVSTTTVNEIEKLYKKHSA
jgi:tRNA-dihydrouridine synthase B